MIESHVSLKLLNTFGVEAFAKYLVKVKTEDELKSLILDKALREEQKLVLGGGSNILLTRDFDGLVLLNRLDGINLVQEDTQFVYVKAMAGVVWHQLVIYAIEHGWGGIENLSLIPGCAGAAPMQNIGAYGVELKDVFHCLEAVDIITAEKREFYLDECEFGYRQSVFKQKLRNKYVITSLTLRLTKNNHKLNTSYGAIEQELQSMAITSPGIKEISEAVIRIRKSKLPDPATLGNAGSFFKNPEVDALLYENLKKEFPGIPGYQVPLNKVKLAAGWLIEQCGWKGLVYGNVGMHKQQALVLVNYGNATGSELYNHASKVKESVKSRFGITLEMEVNVV